MYLSMKYHESKKDEKLREQFQNDFTRAYLRRITLEEGELRGINALDIQFTYPITAIAGKNGAGKSTILAMVCCAYHNAKDGFKLLKRKLPYYTFSDFFVQSIDEVPPGGINIRYEIAHNKWKKHEQLPNGIGISFQNRWKSKGGKWNDYDKRLKRNVVFLGIERIVPHAERSQSKSYSRYFETVTARGWEDKVKDAVGYVLNRKYDKFHYIEHSKYSMPVVEVGSATYSGFNMGAGENALFEVFSTIYASGKGTLLVMDEIELGLHAEAQKRFIDKLKDICLETNTQVICTTHSREIFQRLPDDARFFVESINGKTKVTGAISPDFAFAKLAGTSSKELEILVEDDVAKSLVENTLPAEIRSRVEIITIGSAHALARQLGARYCAARKSPVLVIFDGDQSTDGRKNSHRENAKKSAEIIEDDFDEWFEFRTGYLPGESWPEKWIMEKANECLTELSYALNADEDSLSEMFKNAELSGKHNEFFTLSQSLSLDKDACRNTLAQKICRKFSVEFKPLLDNVLKNLGEPVQPS